MFSLGMDADELDEEQIFRSNSERNNLAYRDEGVEESRKRLKHKQRSLLERVEEDGVTFRSYRDGTTC